MTTTSISVSANIPVELGEMLEQLLRDRLEDLEDYQDAKQAYDEFIASGKKAVPFEDMRKELNL